MFGYSMLGIPPVYNGITAHHSVVNHLTTASLKYPYLVDIFIKQPFRPLLMFGQASDCPRYNFRVGYNDG